MLGQLVYIHGTVQESFQNFVCTCAEMTNAGISCLNNCYE